MKTAEEWLGHIDATHLSDQRITKETIKQIQLDAWKQGMEDASGLIERIPNIFVGEKNYVFALCRLEAIGSISRKIDERINSPSPSPE